MRTFLISVLFIFFSNTIFSQTGVLEDRLRNNIFIEVTTSKTECNVGEPIIVTYKLFSSMESVSNVIKQPAFYGFSLTNLINNNDGVVFRQTIDGVTFDVHTIRRVQLTPTMPGKLQLDALLMSNRVKLTDNNGNKNAVLDGIEDGYTLNNNGEYTFTISSVPITITVNGAPETPVKPATYNGVAGNFRMSIKMPKQVYKAGEKGALVITIAGNGDFNNVKQPVVEWPAGLQIFPAKEQSNYDKTSKNAWGYKAYIIPFSSDKAGSFTIMPVQFSFFDLANNRYNTITNKPITFYVEDAPAGNGATPSEIITNNDNNGDDNTMRAVMIGIGLLSAIILLALLLRRRKKPVQAYPVSAPSALVASAIPSDVFLQQAYSAINQPGNVFYTALKNGIIQFFEKKYNIPAALFNRTTLKNTLTERNIPQNTQNDILHILTEIEMNIYSGGGLDADKQSLLAKTQNALNAL